MINTEKIGKILKKRKDKIPALLEVLRLTANLCKINDDDFDNAVNVALDKVLNLLFLQAQSKKTAGYILSGSDYKALGIFENHIKKLRRKYKSVEKQSKVIRLMPRLYKIKKDKNFSFRQLSEFINEKYGLKINKLFVFKSNF